MDRSERRRRMKRKEKKNQKGSGTEGWLLVVGLTGVNNKIDEKLYDSWQKGEIANLTSDYAGKTIPDHIDSIEQAVQEARKAQPELKPAFVSYPGTGYSGDHHYGVFMKGNSSLSERNFQPVLVDAVPAKLTAVQIGSA